MILLDFLRICMNILFFSSFLHIFFRFIRFSYFLKILGENCLNQKKAMSFYIIAMVSPGLIFQTFGALGAALLAEKKPLLAEKKPSWRKEPPSWRKKTPPGGKNPPPGGNKPFQCPPICAASGLIWSTCFFRD